MEAGRERRLLRGELPARCGIGAFRGWEAGPEPEEATGRVRPLAEGEGEAAAAEEQAARPATIVRHFMGDTVHDCGNIYDPVTGYCPKCDPRLFRVCALDREFFEADTAAGRSECVVSARNVAGVVARYLAGADVRIVYVQPCEV